MKYEKLREHLIDKRARLRVEIDQMDTEMKDKIIEGGFVDQLNRENVLNLMGIIGERKMTLKAYDDIYTWVCHDANGLIK